LTIFHFERLDYSTTHITSNETTLDV